MNIQLSDGRQCVYQWETGRYIKLVEFSACEVVNFFNPSSDNAYAVKTKMIDGILQVMIPNELLQLDKKIILYATGVDNTGNYIQKDGVIPLIPRQKPDNYIYEPSEIMSFESVLVEASGYRDAAKNSADAAKVSENNAEKSRSDAENAAETATQKANESSSSADLALKYRQLSERYAKGTENGSPISSGDGYNDNSKYYKEQAEQVIHEGLDEFNSNAIAKTATFDNNATDKTNTFNQNVTNKTNTFNSNADAKTNSFNSST